nr:iron chelate uptake ABC transporter family permease subunit [Ktedonospora formicarum]
MLKEKSELAHIHPGQRERRTTPFRHAPWVGLLLGLALLLITLLLALCLGSVFIDPPTAFRALFAFDGSTAQDIVRNLRFPRVLIAVCVGSSLAIAGL